MIVLTIATLVVACESESQTPVSQVTTRPAQATVQPTMQPTATAEVTPEPTPLTASPTATGNPSPGVVTGVEASGSAGSGEIEVRWNAGTDPDLDHYNVYRAVVSGGPYGLVSSVPDDQRAWMPAGIRGYIDLGQSGIHCYVVTAVDAAGNEGPRSAEACGSPP